MVARARARARWLVPHGVDGGLTLDDETSCRSRSPSVVVVVVGAWQLCCCVIRCCVCCRNIVAGGTARESVGRTSRGVETLQWLAQHVRHMASSVVSCARRASHQSAYCQRLAARTHVCRCRTTQAAAATFMRPLTARTSRPSAVATHSPRTITLLCRHRTSAARTAPALRPRQPQQRPPRPRAARAPPSHPRPHRAGARGAPHARVRWPPLRRTCVRARARSLSTGKRRLCPPRARSHIRAAPRPATSGTTPSPSSATAPVRARANSRDATTAVKAGARARHAMRAAIA